MRLNEPEEHEVVEYILLQHLFMNIFVLLDNQCVTPESRCPTIKAVVVAAATILMVTMEAADMAAAEVATTMVALADLEEEEAGVTVEASKIALGAC